ncbi:MAG: beta-ketoacyl-[acyl-carrier-protein] synthase family protein [Betaproteobacteria bacterium]|nr:beta-ketoacyl-[acyl-carrier-protein] synthase family protein [Betaproteobacteria bacterium]
MRRVVVTGLGVVSPVGTGAARFFDALLAGRSGIRRITAPFVGQLLATVAGEVDFDPAAHFPKARLAMLDRGSQLALVAAREAIGDSGIVLDESLQGRTGVFMGTGMGGAHTLESGYEDLLRDHKDRLPPYTVLRAMHNAAAAHVSIDFGLRGPSYTFSTACSSSAVAIGEACRAIRHGYADAAIAGGTESIITLGTMRAWEAMRTLAREDAEDPAASCRPFSLDRDGLVLGEGAGLVVLEDLEGARARGARIHAEILGYGTASDASHIAKPHIGGQVAAMQLALADAAMNASEIDYINAHGTATLAGDAVETAAIKQVFGEHARRLAVSSTKSMHGHLMGAAGAVEFIAAVLAIAHRALPPTAHLRAADPECDLDFIANTARHGVPVRAVMSNSFAFGGSDAALIAGPVRD